MESVEVFQELNSLLATGELPSLFSNDEMSGILHVSSLTLQLSHCLSNHASLSCLTFLPTIACVWYKNVFPIYPPCISFIIPPGSWSEH